MYVLTASTSSSRLSTARPNDLAVMSWRLAGRRISSGMHATPLSSSWILAPTTVRCLRIQRSSASRRSLVCVAQISGRRDAVVAQEARIFSANAKDIFDSDLSERLLHLLRREGGQIQHIVVLRMALQQLAADFGQAPGRCNAHAHGQAVEEK